MYDFVYERIETTTKYYSNKLTISVMVQTGCAPTEGKGVVTYEVTNQPTTNQPVSMRTFNSSFYYRFVLISSPSAPSL